MPVDGARRHGYRELHAGLRAGRDGNVQGPAVRQRDAKDGTGQTAVWNLHCHRLWSVDRRDPHARLSTGGWRRRELHRLLGRGRQRGRRGELRGLMSVRDGPGGCHRKVDSMARRRARRHRDFEDAPISKLDVQN